VQVVKRIAVLTNRPLSEIAARRKSLDTGLLDLARVLAQ